MVLVCLFPNINLPEALKKNKVWHDCKKRIYHHCLGLVMSSIVDAYKTGLVHIILSFLYCAGVEFTTPKGTKDFVVSAVFLTIMDLMEASQLTLVRQNQSIGLMIPKEQMSDYKAIETAIKNGLYCTKTKIESKLKELLSNHKLQDKRRSVKTKPEIWAFTFFQ